MKWRHVPVVIQIAVVLQLVILASRTVLVTVDPKDLDVLIRVQLAASSLRYPVCVLLAVGMLELVRRLGGRERLGAQIAFVGTLLELVLMIAWPVMIAKLSDGDSRRTIELLSYGWYAASLGVIAGLVVAVSRRRIAVAAIGLIVGAVAARPPFINDVVARALDLSTHNWVYFASATSLVETAVLLVLVLALGPAGGDDAGREPTEPQLAVRGFQRAARSLWLRVLAVGLAPVLTLVAAVGRSAGMLDTLKLGLLTAAVVGVLSLTLFAIGALGVARARLDGMRAPLLYVGALGALTSAGVALSQLTDLYRSLYGGSGYGFGYVPERVEAWSVVAPIVAIVSLWCLAAAIAGFAGRRNLHDLRLDASGNGVAAGALLLAPLAITRWVLPEMSSGGGFPYGSLLMLVGCAVAGTVMMARLYGRAAGAIEVLAEATLPTARVAKS